MCRGNGALVKALIDCVGSGVADRTPIHPLLVYETELVRGIKVEDVGVIAKDCRIVLIGEKRWHFERGCEELAGGQDQRVLTR